MGSARFQGLRNFLPRLLCLSAASMLYAQLESLLREAAKLDSEGKCAGARPTTPRPWQKASDPRPPQQHRQSLPRMHQPERRAPIFEQLGEDSNPKHVNANLQLARMRDGSEARRESAPIPLARH